MRWRLIALIAIISCNTNNKSKIVVHKLNVDSFQSVLKNYTLIKVDTPARADFYYAFHYKNTDNTFINV